MNTFSIIEITLEIVGAFFCVLFIAALFYFFQCKKLWDEDEHD